MNVLLLYLLLLKATLTSFSGLASLPMVRHDLVERYRVLTDRQLTAAVAAGQMGPGPMGLYVVSVGYSVDGIPGACAGWLVACVGTVARGVGAPSIPGLYMRGLTVASDTAGSLDCRAAVRYKVPCITTLSAAQAAARGIRALIDHSFGVNALQDLHATSAGAPHSHHTSAD